MNWESIFIKPNAISKFMTFKNYLEVKVKGQGLFMGLIRLKRHQMWHVTDFHPPKQHLFTPFRSSGLVQPMD